MLRLYLAIKRIQTCSSSTDSEENQDDSATSKNPSRESSPRVKRRKNLQGQSKKSTLDVEDLAGPTFDSQQHGESTDDVEQLSDSAIIDARVLKEGTEIIPTVFGSSPDPEIAFGRSIAGPSTFEQLEVVYDTFDLDTNSMTNLVFPEIDESRDQQPTDPTASTPDLPSPHNSPRSPTPPAGEVNATVVTIRRSCIYGSSYCRSAHQGAVL